MTYTVTEDMTKDINLAPETEREDILQNVAMILSTPKYTVPMDREFGLSRGATDRPMPVARSILVGELHEQIEKYEPRAKIESITFKEDHKQGKLYPKVEVSINE